MERISRWSKSRINYLHFSYDDFRDYDNFVMELLQVLQEGVQYSLLLKVKYNKDLYAMVGDQIGFLYEKDYDVFENIHRVFEVRLDKFFEDYNVYGINSIQLLYVRVEDMPQLKIKNLNKVNFKVFNEKNSKSRFSIIPLTTNVNYFGKLILKDRELYLDIINKQRASLSEINWIIDEISSMYLYDNYIILSSEKNGIIYRYIYDSVSGILISKVQDQVIKDNLFIRKIGNNSLTILNDKIVKIESERKLSVIKYRPKSLKDEPNPLIGSWDIEAFKDSDGYAKVYALGFYVLNGEVKTYYLEDGMTSEELVLKCIDDMLVNKFRGYTFYTHNLGRYDSTFLIKILKEFNIKMGYEHYILNVIYRDNKPLKLTIKVKRPLSDRKSSKKNVKTYSGFNKITIVDSLNLLNQSLNDLCESFGVEVVKGNFPHKFVNRNTLNYVGDTPSFDYWNNITLVKYKELVKSDWNLREECLKYLEKDLISLTMVINKFSEYINRKHNLQVTDSLTISRLALNIFLKEYLKDSRLPVIGKNMFSDIKKAYYGGVTEVYKPYGKKLFYYDVNSLYPFVALNSMPGSDCTYIENLDNSLDINDLFGFFYCEIETNSSYLGLLPVHTEEGLIMPNGNWEGWYFSEELKYALSQGYKIKVLKGYNFSKLDNVFKDYVNDLYKIKSTTKDRVEKDVNKRLLNHLLGRFGMNIVKPITELVDVDKFSLIESSRKLLGEPRTVTDNDYLITYYPEVEPEICKSHGLDYFKVCNLTLDNDIETSNDFKDVSLTTAAAVTAYARIYMSKVKIDIINRGGNIYYTDTDSIVTDIPLDENLVGNGLGLFKLEHKVKQGYFISNKTYCLQLFEKKIYDKYLDEYKDFVIKSKSVDSESLTIDSFKELYKGIDVKATKRFAITNHSKGSVLIVDDPNVNLNHDSYTKREKIFKRSKWVNRRCCRWIGDAVGEAKLNKLATPNVCKEIYFLKDCLFIVKDKDNIIKSLEDKGYKIHKGYLDMRYQLNTMSGFLYSFDSDYRNCLYKHHLDKVKLGIIPSTSKLSVSKFQFSNIHYNIGNIRYYSTMSNNSMSKNFIRSIHIESKSEKKLFNNRQKLFEKNYSLVGDILSKNSYVTSKEVQLEIEKTLWNQEDLFSSLNENNKWNFDVDTYKFLRKTHNSLCKLLTYPNENTSINNKYNSTKFIPLRKMIISELGVGKVVDILLSYFL